MNILITGASGFLGKNLYNIIRQRNLDAEYKFLTPSSNTLDLLDYNSVKKYFESNNVNKIIHLAAMCGGIGLNQKSPADLTHLNNKMTVNIFDAIRNYNINYFIGLGTVCSYPNLCPVPFKEDDMWNFGGKSQSTNHGYGEAKKMLITTFQQHKFQYGLNGAMFVPVNMYGEHDHFNLTDSHVIPALIKKFDDAVTGHKSIVECWGTGEATREFLYAKDASEAILQAAVTDFDSELPINLGTGQDISIKNLANLIGQLFEFKGEIVFTGAVSDGQPKRRLDVSRAKELLDWSAKTNLKEGLESTIDWYLSHKNH